MCINMCIETGPDICIYMCLDMSLDMCLDMPAIVVDATGGRFKVPLPSFASRSRRAWSHIGPRLTVYIVPRHDTKTASRGLRVHIRVGLMSTSV